MTIKAFEIVLFFFLVPIAIEVFKELCPRLADLLLHWAIKTMAPPELHDRLEEELGGTIDEIDGKVSKLLEAIWITVKLPAMVRGLQGRKSLPEKLQDKLATWGLAAKQTVEAWPQRLSEFRRSIEAYWQRWRSMTRARRTIKRRDQGKRHDNDGARPPPVAIPA